MEDELESFRRQWQQEVSSRGGTRGPPPATRPIHRLSTSQGATSKLKGPVADIRASAEHDAEASGLTFHDLPDKEEDLKLGMDGLAPHRPSKPEPQTALQFYELAVETETAGKLGDSVRLYRQAFKLDDEVDKKYKNKHFPPSATVAPPPRQSAAAPSSVAPKVDSPVSALPPTLAQLIEDFSSLSIPRPPAPTDASPTPPCPIAELPSELISLILYHVAMSSVGHLIQAALTCKRFAWHVLTEEQTWRSVVLSHEQGFGDMTYTWTCDVFGAPVLEEDIEEHDTDGVKDREETLLSQPSFSDVSHRLLASRYASSWRQMYRLRPRIRFHGVYISTVNYTRPGYPSPTVRTWSTPVHIVTYYRYLRFYRDGTVISLLTTAEPIDVVHILTKENLPEHGRGEQRHGRRHHDRALDRAAASKAPHTTLDKSGSGHGPSGASSASAAAQAARTDLPAALPSSVIMRDALRGRWRLSGPDDDDSRAPTTSDFHKAMDPALARAPREPEGDVHIETEGVVPKYVYKMQLGIGSTNGLPAPGSGLDRASGKRTSRNNRLVWKGFWSYNRLTDDWAEFGLKNDRAFWFSRVKSYGIGA